MLLKKSFCIGIAVNLLLIALGGCAADGNAAAEDTAPSTGQSMRCVFAVRQRSASYFLPGYILRSAQLVHRQVRNFNIA